MAQRIQRHKPGGHKCKIDADIDYSATAVGAAGPQPNEVLPVSRVAGSRAVMVGKAGI
ncbi:hypothetical protein GCM10009557_94450 [Virgisporangium ochraceum]